MTLIKFCGLTREQDVDEACALGVDALGFVLWPHSPRAVEWARAAALGRRAPGHVLRVAVLVDATADDLRRVEDDGFDIAQLHGTTPPSPTPALQIWHAVHTGSDLTGIPDADTVLLDADDRERHGGTGQVIDWVRAAAIAASRSVILAGGLTPANVAAAIAVVRPEGVDVSSGIEEQKGIKNRAAMAAFVAAVRQAE